ncbi:MAG: transporter [Solimonas sp.]
MRHPLTLFVLALPFVSGAARADTPAFDRPGIAFSTTTLPAGTFSWEQGLPDVTRSRDEGTTQTLYSADSMLRAGLAPNLELQLAWAPFNHLHQSGAGGTASDNGAGDLGLAFKVALPSGDERLSWAVLGGASFATGNTPFSNGHTQYSLGGTVQWALDDTQALAFYADVDESDGDTALTLSPSYSLALSERLGSFIEAGYTHASHADDDVVAGGGLTWMATPVVQLDVYADFGLTSKSTDLQAGFGVSVFIE